MNFSYKLGTQEQSFTVPDFPEVTTRIKIGRGGGNTVQIPYSNLSKRHLEIFRDKNGFIVIEDVASRNGTFVNGKRLRDHFPHPLKPIDKVKVADLVLKLSDFPEEEIKEEMTQPDPDFGRFFHYGSNYADSSENTQSPNDAPQIANFKIEVAKGAPIQSLPLTKSPTLIGSDPNCGFVLAETGVAKIHAQLTQVGKCWEIADLSDKNGVYVNKKKIAKHKLVDGDQIQIATISLVFKANKKESSMSNSWSAFLLGSFLLLGVFLFSWYNANTSLTESTANPVLVSAYQNLIENAIEMISLRDYQKALTSIDEAKRVQEADQGQLANTLKTVNTLLWSGVDNFQKLDELIEALDRLERHCTWDSPKNFAVKSRNVAKKNQKFLEAFGESKLLHASKNYSQAIHLLRATLKEPDFLASSDEMRTTLEIWVKEQQDRLWSRAQLLMSENKFRESKVLLEEAQTLSKTFNKALSDALYLSEQNIVAEDMFIQAQRLFQSNNNRDALRLLEKISPQSPLISQVREFKAKLVLLDYTQKIQDCYRVGQAEEALRLFSELSSHKFPYTENLTNLKDRIESVLGEYSSLQIQLSSPKPDFTAAGRAAHAILAMETDSENFFHQAAKDALTNFCDLKKMSRQLLEEAKKFLEKKEFSQARSRLRTLSSIPEIESESPESLGEAKILLKSLFQKLNQRYNGILNDKEFSDIQKQEALRGLLSCLEQNDPLFAKITQKIK